MWKSKKIETVSDVVAWRLCMGCGACQWACPKGAIKLHDIVNKGIRPFVEESQCKKCAKCIDVCPGIKLEHGEFPQGCIENLKYGWGPILQLWEGYAVDPEIRYKASSGGAATAIALWAIERGGFAGVLHVMADPYDPIRNIPFFSRSREDLMKTLGSRYAPAAPCQAFDLIKQARGPCVFIGKPCDCVALRKACVLDKELSDKVGLVISIFCAGTPTTAGTLAILKAMKIDDPTSVKSLRYRGYGWPGLTEATIRYKKSGVNDQLAENEENREIKYTMTYEYAWGEILTRYGQLRCRLCPDKTGEFADIALGDPWYRDTQGDDGRSLILLRSLIGVNVWRTIHNSGYIESEPSAWNRLTESQKSLYRGRCELYGRLVAFKLACSPVPLYQGFSFEKNWQEMNNWVKGKTILGTLHRIIKRKWYRRDK